MDAKERAALIRRGNECFNQGDIKHAIEFFVKTKYRDGLTRVGDFYYFDKKQPLLAVKFYRLADRRDRLDEIFERMIMALGQWLGGEGKAKPGPKVKLPPLKVSPKLKILAEEILQKQKSS
jgi:hypothetical protein